MRSGVLERPHTCQEGEIGQIVRFRSSLFCNDHDNVEFRNLQRRNKAKKQDHNPGVQTFSCSGICLEESHSIQFQRLEVPEELVDFQGSSSLKLTNYLLPSAGNQTNVVGGPHNCTSSSGQSPELKRKHTRDGIRAKWPRRNTNTLSESGGIGLNLPWHGRASTYVREAKEDQKNVCLLLKGNGIEMVKAFFTNLER